MKRLLTSVAIFFVFFFSSTTPVLTPSKAQADSHFTCPVAHSGVSSWYTPPSHNGLDFMIAYGAPIYAAKSGTVTYAGWDTTGYGWRIDVDDGIDRSLYAHLDTISVFHGQWVNKGQQIGLGGSSGWSTGPHLHYEVAWQGQLVNPALPLAHCL